MNDIENLTDAEKRQLIAMLAKSLEPKPAEKTENTAKKKVKINDDFTVVKDVDTKRRSPVKASKNTFVDEGLESGDGGIVYAKTPRNRQPAKNVTIKCSVCQRDVTIPASLERGDYYRCERCVG